MFKFFISVHTLTEVINLLEFMKCYSLENIRKKFLFLYILNVSDIIFTIILYNTGLFTEVNSIIALTLNNPVLSILLKMSIPGILLFILSYRISSATEKQLKYSNIITNIALGIYFFINIMHLFYFLLYF